MITRGTKRSQEPKGTSCKGTIPSGEPVFVVVATNHAVNGQVFSDFIQSSGPAGVSGADETHQRHPEDGTADHGIIAASSKIAVISIPELGVNALTDRIAHLDPRTNGRGHGPFGSKPDCAIHRDPAHQPQMQEMSRRTADFPNPVIRIAPVLYDRKSARKPLALTMGLHGWDI
jgi:hypothetical protein